MYTNNQDNNYDEQKFDVVRYIDASDYTKKRKNGRTNRIIALALCCTITGGITGVGGATLFLNQQDETSQVVKYYDDSESYQEVETTVLEESSQGILSISPMSSALGEILTPTELYNQNVSACVGISVSNVSTNAFGQTSTMASSGSGFVITADGYVVTNCHVIADVIDSKTLTIDVSFYDGTSYPATLVGYEEDNDVAVLKIDAEGLNTVEIGDSDALEVGETVYAIGNPLGELTFSLTDGLVSALDRLISTDDGSTMNMFQTNTAINPGNSGGPLFNSSGDVIGITTAKYSVSSSGTSVEGLGFALPIDDVVEIVVDLIEYGYVTGKPYMGVQVADSQYYGATAGAAISYIAQGSSAENAGLQVGDIILAIDDVSIDTASALTAALTSYSAGQSAMLTVSRSDQIYSVSIVFDEKNTVTESANQYVEENTPSFSDKIQIPSQNVR